MMNIGDCHPGQRVVDVAGDEWSIEMVDREDGGVWARRTEPNDEGKRELEELAPADLTLVR